MPGGFSHMLRGVLRPLVKAMIAKGVTAPAVYRLLKEVFVEVAIQDFTLEGKPATDSRVSLLTGVHRKDVRALRDAAGAPGDGGRERISAMTSILGRWLADPALAGPDGAPVPLPRQSDDGPSFDALARAVNSDIRPRTVLDELIRQGVVTVEAETGLLRLRPSAVIGPADSGQKAMFFAENLGDHIAAATENLLADDGRAPYLERAVFYNRLTPGSVDRIEADARREGAEMLARLNRLAFQFQQADRDLPDAGERFRFGIFFFRVDEEADAGHTTGSAAPEGGLDEGSN